MEKTEDDELIQFGTGLQGQILIASCTFLSSHNWRNGWSWPRGINSKRSNINSSSILEMCVTFEKWARPSQKRIIKGLWAWNGKISFTSPSHYAKSVRVRNQMRLRIPITWGTIWRYRSKGRPGLDGYQRAQMPIRDKIIQWFYTNLIVHESLQALDEFVLVPFVNVLLPEKKK